MKRFLRLNSIGAFAVSIFLTSGCLFLEAQAAPSCRDIFERAETGGKQSLPQSYEQLLNLFEHLLELRKTGQADSASIELIGQVPFLRELDVLLEREVSKDAVIEIGREATDINQVHDVFKNYIRQLASRGKTFSDLAKMQSWLLRAGFRSSSVFDLLRDASLIGRQPPGEEVLRQAVFALVRSARKDAGSLEALLRQALPTVREGRLLVAADFKRPSRQVRDQCQTGSCWLESSNRSFESEATLVSGENIRLSVEFLTAHIVLSRALEAVKNSKVLEENLWPFNGGHFSQAVALAKERGVIPENVWQPRRSLVRNSPQVSQQIKEITGILQREWVRLQSRHLGSVPEAVAASFDARAKQAVMGTLQQFTGPLPTRFKWRSADVSTLGFAQMLLPALRQRLHSYRFENEDANIQFFRDSSSQVLDQNGLRQPVEEVIVMATGNHRGVLDRIRALIDSGRAVYLAYAIKHVTYEGGEMVFDKSEVKGDNLHAVAVVDYAVDGEGQVTGLKLQDSYPTNGDGGFLYMSPFVFEKAVVSVEWLE